MGGRSCQECYQREGVSSYMGKTDNFTVEISCKVPAEDVDFWRRSSKYW